jgi:hypothetical protein
MLEQIKNYNQAVNAVVFPESNSYSNIFIGFEIILGISLFTWLIWLLVSTTETPIKHAQKFNF